MHHYNIFPFVSPSKLFRADKGSAPTFIVITKLFLLLPSFNAINLDMSKFIKEFKEFAIKGNMFMARTNKAMVWFNGKTQWSYLKMTNEVNISTPNEAKRMSMNPYTFLSMYKNGYNLSMTTSGSNYVVHMTAQNKHRSVQEAYIPINKGSYKPTAVKMRQGNDWTTISITNFKAKNQPNSKFSFNQKDFPKADVIDLR